MGTISMEVDMDSIGELQRDLKTKIGVISEYVDELLNQLDVDTEAIVKLRRDLETEMVIINKLGEELRMRLGNCDTLIGNAQDFLR